MSRLQSVAAGLWFLLGCAAQADSTWVYAVQLSANVQSAPPAIVLTWPQDDYGAVEYTVSRKALGDSAWTPLASLPGSATSFADTNVSIGSAFEYEVFKRALLGYTGSGYIYAGLELAPTHHRGRVILVVETNATAPLSDELARLESDLVGDGWSVVRKDVSSNQAPASVKALITNEYQEAPSEVRSVFLLGRIPIFFSGNVNWDTHGPRPMPADGWYGDMDGDWSSSPSFFPSTVELMVGRVDLKDMPGVGGAVAWPSETELLRNYLSKDHAWRHGESPVERRSLMGNRRGDEGGGAAASTGYRNFEAFTGHGSIVEANVQDNAPLAERWISKISGGTWLWAYGCGGGQPIGLSGLGRHGIYNDVYSTDLYDLGAKAVFYILFGSWIADWQLPDDFIRAVLATPKYGLAGCLGGRPHWFAHPVGLGQPIGYGARLTMNNTGLYRCYSNALAGGVYVSLLGDPTLRMDPVVPPSSFAAVSSGPSSVQLSWNPSPDASAGFYLYRAPSPSGPYTRLTSAAVNSHNLTDSPPAGTWTYMVRSQKLQVGASGSYYNLSQGIFTTITVSGGGGQGTNQTSVAITAVAGDKGPILTWENVPGTVYRVQGNGNLLGAGWVTLTGPLSSTEQTITWTDPNGYSLEHGFYRIIKE